MKSPSSVKTSSLALCVVVLVSAATSALAGSEPRGLSQIHRELVEPAPAPTLHLGSSVGPALLQQENPGSQWSDDASFDAEAPRRWWALAASVAVPGLGEALTGHWIRGSALIAADAVTWAVRIDRNDEGERLEEEYRAFALEHWDEEQWRLAIGGDPDSDIDENFDLWAASVGAEDAETFRDVALYVSREEDEREWFENLGKWDVFAWGWREFWDPEWNEENNFELTRGGAYRPVPSTDSEDNSDTWFDSSDPYRTPLRTEYQQLRTDSNDAFDTRDQMTTVLLLTRVFSVLQVAYLEGFIGTRYSAPLPADQGPTSRGLGIESFGMTGTGLAWKVTY